MNPDELVIIRLFSVWKKTKGELCLPEDPLGLTWQEVGHSVMNPVHASVSPWRQTSVPLACSHLLRRPN